VVKEEKRSGCGGRGVAWRGHPLGKERGRKKGRKGGRKGGRSPSGSYTPPHSFRPMLCRYIGEFQDGVKHGQGIFYYADGSRCVTQTRQRVGGFVCGCVGVCLYVCRLPQSRIHPSIHQSIHPSISLTTSTTTTTTITTHPPTHASRFPLFANPPLRYEGAFSRGKRDGQGKYFYANGDSYEGQFKVRSSSSDRKEGRRWKWKWKWK
jgi:hypothetical protein